ncbi:thioredoxin O, mitochondrial [Nymphaea colorata]|nr:thioredoxin O, mitochondrial [Nymphaea colorata]
MMKRCVSRGLQLRCLSLRRFVRSGSALADDQPLLRSLASAAKPSVPGAVEPTSIFASSPPRSVPFALSTLGSRTYSSGSSPSNIQLISSEDEFNQSLKKVQDNGSAAIFYFTAVWCGPCKFIAPIIEEQSKKYPHVTTYKIDVDQEGLAKKLSELRIFSVPTLHFFQNGKKVNEVIGADVARLKETMENLYRQ